MATKTTKKVDLAPGQFYEFTVTLPAASTSGLVFDAFDQHFTLAPGDSLNLIVTATGRPLPKSVALPVPPEERKVA